MFDPPVGGIFSLLLVSLQLQVVRDEDNNS